MHPYGIFLGVLATFFLALSVKRLFREIAMLRESAVSGADAARLARPSLWDGLFPFFAAAAFLGSDPYWWPNRIVQLPAAIIVFLALGLTFVIVPASARVGAAFLMNHALDAKGRASDAVVSPEEPDIGSEPRL